MKLWLWWWPNDQEENHPGQRASGSDENEGRNGALHYRQVRRAAAPPQGGQVMEFYIVLAVLALVMLAYEVWGK